MPVGRTRLQACCSGLRQSRQLRRWDLALAQGGIQEGLTQAGQWSRPQTAERSLRYMLGDRSCYVLFQQMLTPQAEVRVAGTFRIHDIRTRYCILQDPCRPR